MIRIKRTWERFIYLVLFAISLFLVTFSIVQSFRSIKQSDDLKEDLLACGIFFIGSSYCLYEATIFMITTWRTFEITNSGIAVNYGLFKSAKRNPKKFKKTAALFRNTSYKDMQGEKLAKAVTFSALHRIKNKIKI